jgi:hypothetical protein
MPQGRDRSRYPSSRAHDRAGQPTVLDASLELNLRLIRTPVELLSPITKKRNKLSCVSVHGCLEKLNKNSDDSAETRRNAKGKRPRNSDSVPVIFTC